MPLPWPQGTRSLRNGNGVCSAFVRRMVNVAHLRRVCASNCTKQISHTGMRASNERKHLVRKRLLWRPNLMAYQLFVLQTVRCSYGVRSHRSADVLRQFSLHFTVL